MNLFLNWLNPKGYNPPINKQMLWNQWLHQGYLWNWYSYEFYSKHTQDSFPNKPAVT